MRSGPLSLFLSYAHADESIAEALRRHLSPLRHEGVVEAWYDRDLGPGDRWDDEISARLEAADIVIALLSADFVASEYAYGRELRRALELHQLGRLVLVPVIGRACYWQSLPIGSLQALPDGGRPITSWDDRDSAYVTVVRGIEAAARARLAGGSSLVDDWLTSRLIRRRVIRAVQEHLHALALYAGPIDGIPGGMTEKAVRSLQRDAGLTVDGMIGPEIIRLVEDTGENTDDDRSDGRSS